MVAINNKIIDELNIDIYTKEGIEIENCIINNLQLTGCSFAESVKIVNCNIGTFNAISTWFEEGLIVKNSIFLNDVSFEAGGHNKIGYSIAIENNVFNCYVDFFDAQYIGTFVFRNNIVLKGSNLLNNTMEYPGVIFETQSEIVNNLGELNT